MASKIKLDGKTYDLALLSDHGLQTFEMLKFATQRLEHAQLREAALKRAKNSHVADLRSEIVKITSGIDLDALLGV